MLFPSLRWSSLTALLLLACQSPPPALTDAARATVEEQVRETVVSLMEAMNSHDPDAVLAHYERTPDFTYLGVTEMRLGWDAFARVVRPWYASHEDVTFDYEIVRVRALAPDAALAVIRGRSSDTLALAWTQVLTRNADGRWRIVHEHEAWPGADPPSAPHPM